MSAGLMEGAEALMRVLQARHRQVNRALEKAIRMQAARLRKTLKAEIRGGSPGGRPLTPLSFMARKLSKTTRPLRKLSTAVRYDVQSKDPYQVAVGWTGPRVSRSWKYIARVQQEGFTRNITEKQEQFFRHRGKELTRRSKFRKYFFLREETTRFVTPARSILEPFWDCYRRETWQKIRREWKRNLADEIRK